MEKVLDYITITMIIKFIKEATLFSAGALMRNSCFPLSPKNNLKQKVWHLWSPSGYLN